MSRFRPVPNDTYRKAGGQLFLKLDGESALRDLGDCEDFTLTPNVEEIERFDKISAVRSLAASDVTQIDAEISMTLLNHTNLVRALAAMGDPKGAVVQHFRRERRRALLAADHQRVRCRHQ